MSIRRRFAAPRRRDAMSPDVPGAVVIDDAVSGGRSATARSSAEGDGGSSRAGFGVFGGIVWCAPTVAFRPRSSRRSSSSSRCRAVSRSRSVWISRRRISISSGSSAALGSAVVAIRHATSAAPSDGAIARFRTFISVYPLRNPHRGAAASVSLRKNARHAWRRERVRRRVPRVSTYRSDCGRWAAEGRRSLCGARWGDGDRGQR